ncbi:hypothetical protein ACSBR2_001155 [Camellia fascicularis]
MLFAYAVERSFLKSLFEKNPKFFEGLLIFVLLGTCMAIDDGVLTPAISGTKPSSIDGIQTSVDYRFYAI